jgi:hypothetical protein
MPPTKEIPNIVKTRIDHTLQYFKEHIPTSVQRTILNDLTDHPSLMVIQTDKNLGPAIIDRTSYISHMFNDHLLDSDTYQRLNKVGALDHIKKITDKLLMFIDRNFKPKSNERTYLERALSKVNDSFAYFYLLA